MSVNFTERGQKKQIFKFLWAMEQFEKLRGLIPEERISNKDLKTFLINEYDTKKTDYSGRLFNNVDLSNEIISIENYLNRYFNNQYILSGYDCLYETHDNAINIGAMALDSLLSNRKVNKKKMEAAEYGSDEYIYYKVIQLTYKVLANSYYGILGEKNSIFYNPFVQNSITLSAQDLITTSIIAMETFLDNNFKFKSLNDFLTYKNNILKETYSVNILDYVSGKDFNIVYDYFKNKLPEDSNFELLKIALEKLSLEELNRLYWKNNTREIIRENWFKEKLGLVSKYEYTIKIADEIKTDMDDLKDRIIEFCFYNHLFYDKYIRALEGTRDVICTIDTDLTKWVLFKRENLSNCGKLLRALTTNLSS